MSQREVMLAAYRDALRKYGDSPAAMLYPKGRQDVKYDALTRLIPKTGASVLDFGCGLAYLLTYFKDRSIDVEYVGVDLLDEFVRASAQKHPGHRFEKIDSSTDIRGSFDFVVISGTFNFRSENDDRLQARHVRETIADLFEKTNCALAVDFLTSHVDFRQVDSYHEDPHSILDFAMRSLSRRVILDHSYMPYEFALTVIKDAEIARPDNVYRHSPL